MKIGLKIFQNIGKVVEKNTKPLAKKPLYCEEYWKDALIEGIIKPTNNKKVSMHGYLNSINHYFITGANPKNIDKKSVFTNKPPREMISETDFEFKSLSPTKEDLHTYRCIGNKPDFFSEYKLFQRAKSVKAGDTVIMREYAYTTSDKNYATSYLGDDGGIMYDIKIGKGAQVSRIGDVGTNDEVVFPRSSLFKCIKTEEVKQKYGSYLKVFLEYINPNKTIKE